MSTKRQNVDELSLLLAFARIRRQLNLMATQMLKPHGIGPKQALLLRELRMTEIAAPSELSRRTHTDPASTGKVIESLLKKKWVKRTEDPNDRRCWRVSLTEAGAQAAHAIEVIYRDLARNFRAPLSAAETATINEQFNRISTHLETLLSAVKEAS